MSRLIQLIERAKAAQEGRWHRKGHVVTVKLGRTAHEQKIHITSSGDHYVLTSIVLGARAVNKRPKRRRQLALLAWQRNAEHQLVNFAFDRRNRLVGRIQHPTDTLDLEELELYINVLAHECDRFEYLLTGRDNY